MSVAMQPRIPGEPVAFGAAGGELAGFYHAPHRSADRDATRGVLLCPSIGCEYLSAYRTFRVLAERLAASGLPTLRFDYYATGNSSGSDRESGLVARWLDDVVTAATALRQRSGVESIALVGLRVGGTLAAVAAERTRAEALVLWDACVTGRAYLREARTLHRLRFPQSEPAANGDVESVGFLLSAETARALEQLTLVSLPARPAPRVLLAERRDRPSATELAERLEALGSVVERRPVDDCSELTRGALYSPLAEQSMTTIAAWLAEPGDARARGEQRAARPSRVHASAVLHAVSEDGSAIVESPMRFGDGDRLYGVSVERAGGADRALPAVILPNTGADHHVGPHRLWTVLGRRWAALGFRVLRFDISGLGESLPGPSRSEHVAYAPEAVSDLRAAATLMHEPGGPAPLVIGVCTGGYFAVQAVLAGVPLGECIAANPQFYWYEGMPVDARVLGAYHDLRRYPTSMISWAKWRRLLTGQTRVVAVAKRLASGARIAVARMRHRPPRGSANEMLAALADAAIPTFLLFGDSDEGWLHAQLHAGQALRQLSRSPAVTIDVVARADHTFMPHWCQEILAERLTRRLESRHLSGAGRFVPR